MVDVARLAGVHSSTVSLALRNHQSIPKATRDRVVKAAEKIGYRPHPLVSALMSFRRSSTERNRHSVLAFVTSSRPASAWRESRTMCDQLAGAQERAQMFGYRIEEFPLYAPGMTPTRYNDILRSRGIAGLIIAPLRNETDTLPIQWEHFSAVATAFTLRHPNILRVGNDHSMSVRQAIAQCRSYGYKRIGLAVQSYIMDRVEQQWLAGYLVERATLYPRPVLSPLIATEWNEGAFRAWFQAQRPDVVITGGDYASVLAWLKAMGLGVPAQVGVVSLDLHVRDGSVAGIDQHSEELGAVVVDNLIARLQRNDRGAASREERLHVMGEWVDGATIRAVSGPIPKSAPILRAGTPNR